MVCGVKHLKFDGKCASKQASWKHVHYTRHCEDSSLLNIYVALSCLYFKCGLVTAKHLTVNVEI